MRVLWVWQQRPFSSIAIPELRARGGRAGLMVSNTLGFFSLSFFFLMQNCLCFVFVQPKKKRCSVWVDVFSARSSLKCLVLLYRMLFQCMKYASVLMCLQGWVHCFVPNWGEGEYQGLQAPRITSEKSLPKFAPIPMPCNPHDTKTLL